ncbi:hypothetical protein WN55_10515 [Dufourea novaeangliae]|uniref:Uncharacterized protein n=1 Tax=Dufourea novaeangliae TaxID=178035 RepID=A0A154P5J0_DUFNO|nr:hypothetical protein WN55_10515 [Dufourea novaeangliae]
MWILSLSIARSWCFVSVHITPRNPCGAINNISRQYISSIKISYRLNLSKEPS